MVPKKRSMRPQRWVLLICKADGQRSPSCHDTGDGHLARSPPDAKRYGEKALEESAARADQLFAEQDYDGAAVWRRIIDAVGQLANTTPSGRLH
jgi:hypothetical protein